MKERARQVLITAFLILSAIFFICSVFIMFSQAVYIPYWDQWDWLRRYYSGNETLFSLLFTPINGHIVAIPGLLYRPTLPISPSCSCALSRSASSCARSSQACRSIFVDGRRMSFSPLH
jgi:hypothetical protein